MRRTATESPIILSRDPQFRRGPVRSGPFPAEEHAQAVRVKPGDKVDNAIKANVERLKGLDPILSDPVKKGELEIVGAVYELRTGAVKWLD